MTRDINSIVFKKKTAVSLVSGVITYKTTRKNLFVKFDFIVVI